MKTMLICAIVGILLLFPITNPVSASQDTITIDISKLDQGTRDKILKSVDAGKSVGAIDQASVREWAEIITTTVKEMCQVLNVEVNEFVKTPVGMIIAGTLIYKIIGKDVLYSVKTMIVGAVWWVLSMLLLYFVAKKFIIPHKVKVEKISHDDGSADYKETKVITYKLVGPYEFYSRDTKAIAVVAMIAFGVISTFVALVCLLA